MPYLDEHNVLVSLSNPRERYENIGPFAILYVGHMP